jgi:hypothetical protein
MSLLKHHYSPTAHEQVVSDCPPCALEIAFVYAGINERQARDLLGKMDELGITLSLEGTEGLPRRSEIGPDTSPRTLY